MIRKQKVKGTNKVKVTFVLPDDLVESSACVVGDFNGWNPSANPFIKRSNRTYSTAVRIGHGERHEFRYVAEGGQWMNEADADAFQPNVFGTENCVLET